MLTCTSDTGVADLIEWVTKEGVVLASDTAVEELQLVLSPVNDSLSVHMAKFTCIVTKNSFDQTSSNQTIPVTVLGVCRILFTLYICMYVYIYICMYVCVYICSHTIHRLIFLVLPI